ncbi:MAG: response regulator [Lachnospiraceae bacterium]|nr:response regulator [Lachnospiraceae bacterium]
MSTVIVTAETVAIAFMLLILIAILQQNRFYKSKRTRVFIIFALVEIVGLMVDATSYLIEGNENLSGWIAFVNASTFVITNFSCIIFALYVITAVREKCSFSYAAVGVVAVLSAVDTIWLIWGVYNGKLFRVVDGYIIYGYWRDYVSVVPLLSIVVFLTMAFMGIRRLGGKQTVLLSTYFIFPLMDAAITLFYPEYDFSYVASSLACCTIFIFIQVDAATEMRVGERVLIDANKAKTEFLARMSHEIRTPVNTVLGMDEMILRESKEEAIREYAGDIQSAGRSLLAIINDILDLSKIESGKMEILPVEYDVSELLYDLYNMVSIRAKEKNLLFNVSISPVIPSKLYGDDVRIRQIITNLLTNAIKYTESGSVWFRVSLKGFEKDDENDERDYALLHFEVEDTGIGIRAEDMDKLFGDFERVDDLRNRNIEGTGLGIPITMKLLKLMGSELKVQSIYEKGSVFSFDLRQEIINKEPMGDFRENPEEMGTERTEFMPAFVAPNARILIVDDNSMNRKVFVSLLRTTGISVTEAENGPDAISLASKQYFDIIFMDHMMPDMDGIEAMQHIREITDGPCDKTPIIVLTANAIAGSKDKYMAEGFNGYLSKPIDYDDLEKTIIKFLPHDKARTAIDRDTCGVSASDQDSFDCDKLPVIFGIDWRVAKMRLQRLDILDSVLSDFRMSIDQQAERLQRFKDGLPETLDDYRIMVHAMKSTSGSVGIIPLSGMAAVLEKAAGAGDMDTINRIHDVFVQEYRSYKERLKDYFKAEDANEDDREEIGGEVLKTLFDMLKVAMEDMDIESADKAMDKLSLYRLPENVTDELDNLKSAVISLDQDAVVAILDRIETGNTQ